LKKVYLSLTGGLGNQLFQLSAAMAVAKENEVVIEWINSRPRLNSNHFAEISEFELPKNVTFRKSHRFQILSSKAVGYLLRMGVNPRKYEDYALFGKLASTAASLINMLTFRKYIQIRLNQGVGYFPNVSKESKASLHLIGYFQTYKWSEESAGFSSLANITIRQPSKALTSLTNLAEQEDPLVIHMRFGDYRLENSFGFLTPDYYQESIRELWKSDLYKSAWVFSDEIDEARKYLQGLGIKEIRYIADVADSSAQTLEAMRLGKGYVIGNSSFSWWAARLSRNQDAKVIAPSPWFIGQKEPAELIPPNWVRRMGH
jgi:hypothetical protein